nr:YsnF/AvaK domain-containing protein [Streptomyces sp. CBMA156]
MRTLSTPAPAAGTSPAPAAPTAEPKHQSQPAPTPAPAAAATSTANTTNVTSTGPASTALSGPVEITCREERLEITTEWRTLGTAKLRKYVTTEQVERRVPVVRERVRVERTPVSDAERATLTEKDIAEAVEEVTLREEHPVVRKFLAPIERVRLVVERYTTEEVIRDELRREQVEVHDTTTPASASPPPDASSRSTPSPDSPRPASLRPLV